MTYQPAESPHAANLPRSGAVRKRIAWRAGRAAHPPGLRGGRGAARRRASEAPGRADRWRLMSRRVASPNTIGSWALGRPTRPGALPPTDHRQGFANAATRTGSGPSAATTSRSPTTCTRVAALPARASATLRIVFPERQPTRTVPWRSTATTPPRSARRRRCPSAPMSR
jgi:hypothetical protein